VVGIGPFVWDIGGLASTKVGEDGDGTYYGDVVCVVALIGFCDAGVGGGHRPPKSKSSSLRKEGTMGN
jgi:hypothetical protein